MKVDPVLRREALNLGFTYVRDARHGELWQHQRTGRIACIARMANTSPAPAVWASQLKSLQRAAAHT